MQNNRITPESLLTPVIGVDLPDGYDWIRQRSTYTTKIGREIFATFTKSETKCKTNTPLYTYTDDDDTANDD